MGFRTLNIGMTALLTQKIALDSTGHNIANAATPGYARQRVNMEANRPQVYAYGAVGTGVDVNRIEHLTDEFLEIQVRSAMSDMGSLNVSQDGYENLEVYFNELTGNDISSAFDNFWNSLQDFNNNVEDVSTRRNVASLAQTLCDTFQSTRQKIYDFRYQQNLSIREAVDDVNEITNQISVLNKSIMKIEAGGATGVVANDLRDQRTERLKELSELLDISVTEESNGSVIVAQKGRMLVFEDKVFELTTERMTKGGMLVDEVVFAEDYEEVEMEAGKLFGMTQMRDEVAMGFQEDVDQLAGEFLWNFNRQHSQGVGLEGYNSTTADYEILNPMATLDQLDYHFTPAENTFEIVNGSFEIIVYDKDNGEETRRNIDILLDGVDDDEKTILANTEPVEVAPGVWETQQPDNSLLRKIQDALDSVVPGTFEVKLEYGNQISITSKSEDIQFAFGRDSSGALAALGLNTFFTGYDAETISVREEFEDSPQFLAGADEFITGDQSNAIQLLSMRTQTLMNGNTATFEDFYEGIIGRLGIEGQRVSSLHSTQTDILLRVENQREDLSGVNLDEEMTKMVQFQKSYQAAAKFVATAQVIYDTLINMVQ